MSRQSICFPRWGTQDVTKGGDDGFEQELLKWYSVEEAAALEGLVDLKAKLRSLPTDKFLTKAVEGISHIMGSDMAFIIKRILVDDQKSAIEMPPIGEPGSCLMAAALHYCTSTGEKHTIKENTFHAYACPCAYMRHDKIFVIPENIDTFITNNPNKVPIPVDAYMAVPLFAEDKCVAHFGVMWSKEHSPNKRLSWSFVEMMLHALEDLIGQRLLEGSKFVAAQTEPSLTASPTKEQQQHRVIPHHAISVAQSLRPYAGSLSHELRTPMQGVVGMLDVMYTTVQDAVQSSEDPHLKMVFQNLIESIEVVQDSSRRAVVAADNVVHAYDMNMSIPESAVSAPDPQDDGTISPRTLSVSQEARTSQPDIVVAGHDLPLARANAKRRRDVEEGDDYHKKAARLDNASPGSTSSQEHLHNGDHNPIDTQSNKLPAHHTRLQRHTPQSRSSPLPPSTTHHVHRSTDIRAVIRYVINEGLKTGGRPDYVSALPIDQGEIIEVKTRGSDTTIRQMIIKWTVDDDVPTTLNFDEKDFSKLISCLVLNSIKFTDRIEARIEVAARRKGRHTTITVADNGPGMPAEFLPRLFKPFSQKDSSITRQSDGLGLGLMVAKGMARKLGGDLVCLRSETEAPDHGCTFEIRLPLAPGETISRPTSPLASPITQRRLPSLDFSRLSEREVDHSVHTDMLPAWNATSLDATVLPAENQALKRSLSTLNENAKAQARVKLKVLGKNKSSTDFKIDSALSKKYPLTFLVAEDNKINRKLLVSMLSKFGYTDIIEAHDGAEAVRQMKLQAASNAKVDVVLMDLWMPLMDGYEATEKILQMDWNGLIAGPTVLAVTADVTDDALDRAAQVGMKGFMTKPYKLQDLQRLITEYCTQRQMPPVDPVDATILPPVALIV